MYIPPDSVYTKGKGVISMDESMNLGFLVASMEKLERNSEFSQYNPRWPEEIVFLFAVNPESTVDLIEARLKEFPDYSNGLEPLNQVIFAYQKLNFSHLSQSFLNQKAFWIGYHQGEKDCNLSQVMLY